MKNLKWKLLTNRIPFRWVLYEGHALVLKEGPRGITDCIGRLGVEERIADEDGVSHQGEGGAA